MGKFAYGAAFFNDLPAVTITSEGLSSFASPLTLTLALASRCKFRNGACLLELRRRPKGGQLSLRGVANELAARGFLNERGKPYAAKSVTSILKT